MFIYPSIHPPLEYAIAAQVELLFQVSWWVADSQPASELVLPLSSSFPLNIFIRKEDCPSVEAATNQQPTNPPYETCFLFFPHSNYLK
jgi:hypothetical protein